MKAVYALLVTVFVIVATVPGAASVPGSASVSPASTVETTAQVESDGETELGDDVTTFLQSTAAETRGVVANEKWEAQFERSGDRRAVERRIDRLEAELVELRQRRQALASAAENGTIPESKYYGRLGELDGELSALAVSIDATEAAADRVGANASRLSTLRAETRETHATIAGPGEVAGPPDQPPGRANGTDNTDETSEARRAVDTTVETPGDNPAALDHREGGEDTGDADDARKTDDERRQSPDEETPPTDSTAQPDDEALGKEDVQSLDT